MEWPLRSFQRPVSFNWLYRKKGIKLTLQTASLADVPLCATCLPNMYSIHRTEYLLIPYWESRLNPPVYQSTWLLRNPSPILWSCNPANRLSTGAASSQSPQHQGAGKESGIYHIVPRNGEGSLWWRNLTSRVQGLGGWFKGLGGTGMWKHWRSKF